MMRSGRLESPPANPLFAVALLRIALELKKSDAELDTIVARVVTRMKLKGDDFRRYLDSNVGLLRTASARALTPAAANLAPEAARAPAPRRRTQRG